ncbi:acid protease [Coniophora puteana RWD-64-598 SS2]|uniref:Acid protease n=1 Tax=Coniophora puteana (strain RWD-64-598) TaxID=741705 RepID=A0A5M3ML50_CONPW|nr:acid protease [Coniophora puteana RWD-64-598 SS2]EIW79969.1 acid protease [Coniophora puteana RWD-64-598 SS2]
MFPSHTLLSICLLATVVAAVPAQRDTKRTPSATLGVTRRFRNLAAGQRLPDIDRARAAALKQGGQKAKRDGAVSVTNTLVTYTASVGIGSPATQYTLLIDTGSSNTWVGADKPYNPTSSSTDTGNTITDSYGSGEFTGKEYIDTVTLGNNLTIAKQMIGVASQAEGFQDVDGVLGVGPVDLTAGTVSNTNTVPTVMDNLYSQGTISHELLGVYYAPVSSSDSTGELSFGTVDTSKTTSDVAYVPITSTQLVSEYWGIDQSISYGSQTILDSASGIVDTGTTLILVASDAFQKYQSATGGTMDQTTGLLTISADQYDKLSALNFEIGGTTYALNANAQIWPRSLNSAIGGASGSIYLVVNDVGSASGEGIDFINGYTFLERYYSVFDTTNKRVGFATTANTNATSN